MCLAVSLIPFPGVTDSTSVVSCNFTPLSGVGGGITGVLGVYTVCLYRGGMGSAAVPITDSALFKVTSRLLDPCILGGNHTGGNVCAM